MTEPQLGPLTDDALTGGYRVLQRKQGHRYSIDDVLTAHEACRARPDATHYVDLGCGLGSVLLMVAYKLPGARVVGVEAQDVSFQLAQQNVERNGQVDRITVQRGDLRDLLQPEPRAALLQALGRGEGPQLISGTPPYMPVGTSTPSPDEQRRYARVELRGGVEAYLAAIGALLAPGGRGVVCCDARTPERALRGAAEAGLLPLRRLDAIPREGAEALFSVWTCARQQDVADTVCAEDRFVARDREGQRTPPTTPCAPSSTCPRAPTMPPRDRTPRPSRPSAPRPNGPKGPRSPSPRSAEPQRTPVVRSALANVGGAVTTRGDATHAAALGEAMQAAEHSPPDVATHGMHAYPARMHAAIATHVIERLTKPGARVVDPFCGSGTVLVEAMTLGRRSAGVDLNPLAIRIAEVKTTRVDAVRRERLAVTIEGLGERSEERVRTRTHTQAPLTPEDAKWYEGHTLKELAGLHAEIAALENEDDRRLLEMLFSAIVVKFSIQRAETTERVAERRIRKGLPTEFFVRRGMEWLDRWVELEAQITERAPAEVFAPRLVQGDARKLRDHVGAAPVDLVLSSPPYGGTYDYVHHHVRRYPWLGIDPTQLERNELGRGAT
ncbi:MAG: methyltransferase domain-containing protein [Sandaracinaceae bacterium]|nr:methyltransferase domain-containing protein [Sandaracinaceae bacterium]